MVVVCLCVRMCAYELGRCVHLRVLGGVRVKGIHEGVEGWFRD